MTHSGTEHATLRNIQSNSHRLKSYTLGRIHSGVSRRYVDEFGRQAFLDDHLRNGKRVLTTKFDRHERFATIKLLSSFFLTMKFDRQA